jgi:hypothetical protein
MTNLHPPIAAALGDVTTARLDLRFEQADLDDLAVVFAHSEVWQFPPSPVRRHLSFFGCS